MGTRFPPLEDSELALPPPPPERTGSYFYGYKLFDNDYDEKLDEHQERMGKIINAVGGLKLYAQLAWQTPTVIAFLAIYHPDVGLVTPRAGNSRIPCQTRLEMFQKEIGIDFGPSWQIDDGSIFQKGYTVKDWLRSIQPIPGLWTLE
ncbi:hypothetical protein C8R44DRAFT_868112 [Mycena epipterygia]|nr:hypothetical protein C8R44DRAFT_868112 [Mycena epipterygia]